MAVTFLTNEDKSVLDGELDKLTKATVQLSDKIVEIGTQEDIVQQVIAALGTPVFGTVDADKNIILKSSNLAEGTYTYYFEDKDGTRRLIGTDTVAGESGPVEIPLTWETGAYLDKTTGAVTQTGNANYSASIHIDITQTKVYTLARTSNVQNVCGLIWYDASGKFIKCDDKWLAQNGNLSGELPVPSNAAKLRLRLWYETAEAAKYESLYSLTSE